MDQEIATTHVVPGNTVDETGSEVRLYEPIQHFFIIGVTMLWSAIAIPALAIDTFRSGHPIAGVVILVIALGFVRLVQKTMWAAKRVYLHDGFIGVGRGPRRRTIPLTDIVRVEKPSWTRPDRSFVPTEVTVRNGRPVLFFPSGGAEALLRERSGTSHVPPATL